MRHALKKIIHHPQKCDMILYNNPPPKTRHDPKKNVIPAQAGISMLFREAKIQVLLS
jgi:hypothetical protein